MADYKDYIVRYDIQTNLNNAISGFKALGKLANKYGQGIKGYSDQIANIMTQAERLKGMANITFTINTAEFQAQLNAMVEDVEIAAGKMQSAIYRGLTGSGKAKTVAKKGVVSSFFGKSIKEAEESIKAIEDRYNKLMGTPTGKNGQRKGDGAIQMHKNALRKDPLNAQMAARLKEMENEAALLKRLKSQGNAYIKEQKEVQSKILSAGITGKGGANTKVAKNATQTPLVSLPSEQQLKAFRNLKSKTVTLTFKGQDNVSKLITNLKRKISTFKANELPVGLKIVADTVNEQIRAIKPLPIEVQVKAVGLRGLQNQISKLSGPVGGSAMGTGQVGKSPLKPVAPSNSPQGLWTNPKYFTTEDQRERNALLKSGYSNLKGPERKRLQELNQKRIEGYVGRNITNEEFKQLHPYLKTYEKYKDSNLVKGQKGYSQFQKAYQELEKSRLQGLTGPVNVPKTPLLPYYPQTRQQPSVSQIPPSLNGKSATLRLLLDTSPALATLQSFIAQVRATTATMKLGASKAPVAPSTPITPLAPTAPIIPFAPTNILNQPNNSTPSSGTTQSAGNGKGTTGHQVSKSLAPSGFVGSGKSRIYFGEQKPPQELAPQGYHWQRNNNLASKLSNSQAVGYSEALAKQQEAFNKLASVNASTKAGLEQAKTLIPTTQRYTKLSSLEKNIRGAWNESIARKNSAMAEMRANQPLLASYKKQFAQLEQTRQSLMALPKLNSSQKRTLQRIEEAQKPLISNIQKLSAPLDRIAREDKYQSVLNSRLGGVSNAMRQEETQARSQATAPLLAQRRDARTAYQEARSNANKYTRGWSMVEDKPKSAPTPKQSTTTKNLEAVKRLERMRSNAVAPYVKNASQMNLAAQNLPYFRGAMTAMNLTPSADLWNNSAYLREVQRQMIAANAKVPSYMPTAIAQAERAEARATATPMPMNTRGSRYGRSTMMPSVYDRSRRWGYLFTGNTSFGAKTPMAVDMAKGMGVMFAVGGAMSAISNSFGQAMEYQNTMKTTQAILENGTDNFTSSGFKNMERTVRDVGVKTKFSAPEVASAARFLAMAGYDIEGINNAIRPIADLALMGDYDLGETADKMTNIMTTFGVTSDKMKQDPNIMRKYGNIMAAVATRSNTDVMMLAESAKYGGGVANMYGREDPNNFADTMALFGVMGNAGIQGSSAGTALRMMYQNTFAANGKQGKIWQQLEDVYGIKRYKSDGSKRSMADIIMDMANLIDPKDQADIISKLYRITAQPGANAAINAATNENYAKLIQQAKEEGTNADEAAKAMESVANLMDKGGLGALAKLMKAAREAVNGDALGSIAGEKQNTIQGLWAQVTSTFTEGIVKAFESRQGGFEELLKKLRDYLAKPETVSMIKNLIDMITEIGKVMAWFVNIWAKFYNFAPGLIKAWVVAQMAFTQLGTLIAPVISLIGILDRFGLSLNRLSIAGTAATASIGRTSAAGVATMASKGIAGPMTAPLVVGKGNWGKGLVSGSYDKKISGAAAMRARKAMIPTSPKLTVTDALLAGSMIMPTPLGGQRTAAFAPLAQESDRRTAVNRHNQNVLNRYSEVRARANRIYGWGRVSRGFTTAAQATLSAATFAPMFGGLKSMFFSLMTGLAKAVGFLVNPITLATAGIGALGFGAYKLYQLSNGATEAQIQAREHLEDLTQKSLSIIQQDQEGYEKLRQSFSPVIEIGRTAANVFDELINKYEAALDRFREKYGFVLEEPTGGASDKATQEMADTWVDHLLNSNAALGFTKEQREAYENGYLTDWKSKKAQITPANLNGYQGYNSGAAGLVNWINQVIFQKQNEKETKEKMLPGLIQEAGATAPSTNNKIKEILQEREKYVRENKSLDQWKEWAKAEAKTFANVEGATKTASGLTQKEFEQNRDYFPDFDVYREGVYQKLISEINGEHGSITAYNIALEQLKSKALEIGSDKWREAIGNVLNFKEFAMEVYDKATKGYRQFDFILRTTPEGKIDMSNLAKQVAQKVDGAKITLYKFSDSLAQIYKKLAELGVISIEEIPSLLQDDLQHSHLDREVLVGYFEKYIKGNKNSEWVKAGYDADKYADEMMKGQGKNARIINVAGKQVNTAKERALVRKTTARDSFDSQIKPYTDQIQNAVKQNAVTPDSNSSTTPETPTAPNQSDYASHYEREAAKPTHVSINIQNLANFDRTTIAANAEERDLIASLEGKIADAVYRIFAEASNQVQLAYNG